VRLALALALLASPIHAAAPYGIILLAHGGDASWNAQIESLRASVDAKVPAETALGMADPAALQAAVDRLEKRGAARIVAVPLFVQSRSEVLDQTRYALKLADEPSAALRAGYERMAAAHAGMKMPAGAPMMHHEFSLARVSARGKITMTPALDDDPFVAKILAERALALSRRPDVETVVLVAHGPADDAAVPAWERSLANLADAVKVRGKFRRVIPAMLRDDSPPAVRAASVVKLRRAVALGASNGRALVVPVLIARGGIEEKIAKDLDGLDYAWDGKTLMPHDGFDAWVLETAAKADRAGH
jgi:hypothetical protein